MSWRGIGGGAAAALLVVLSSEPVDTSHAARDTAQQETRLFLAVMRRDGVMIPFAEYDGGRWSKPWPATVRNVEVPASIDAIPRSWWGGEPPKEWRLWPFGGRDAVPLAVKTPIVTFAGRARRLGMRTDYSSPEAAAPPFELPYPKDGLAIAGGAALNPVATISRYVPQRATLMETLRAEIEEVETRAVEGLRNSARWIHPATDDFRARVPVELEQWYTVALPQPGFSVSYIEAVKKYPALPEDEGCGLETFISGWVHHNTRLPKPTAELRAKITYCDREGVSYMLPFGHLTLRNRTHVVYQMSGWDHEWYVVVETQPGRLKYVVEYFGGGPAPE